MGGDSNDFYGDLHSNDNLKWQGADLNHVTGEATYVDDYYESTNVYTNNTWDQGYPLQDSWKPWPDALKLDPSDYVDDGPVETMYPGEFFEYYGDTHIDGSTPDGVHVIYGDGKFTFEDSLSGTFTFVILPSSGGVGEISYSASFGNLTAFHDDILFYTEYWKTGQDYAYVPPPYSDPPECGAPAIQMSGNQNTFAGLFISPRGMIEWNGNENTLEGGLAGFNLKYNGNFNTMNTIPGGASPKTVLVE